MADLMTYLYMYLLDIISWCKDLKRTEGILQEFWYIYPLPTPTQNFDQKYPYNPKLTPYIHARTHNPLHEGLYFKRHGIYALCP